MNKLLFLSMEIQEILNQFVKECSEKLNLLSLVRFGSSTYSENFDDIDLMFVFNTNALPSKDIRILIKIIKKFEKENSDLVFDFGGAGLDRKKKGKYSITCMLISKKTLMTEHNPNDLIFFKNLISDKNKKILFGKNPFENLNVKITNQHLHEALSVNVAHSLRKSLDDKQYKLDASYDLFKKFLRDLLVDSWPVRKEELLEKFGGKFKEKIKLPENSKEILSHNLKEEDFEDILKFAEDCLKYLAEEK